MDTIETIHKALVQHGPHNDRIYLMRLNGADPYRLITALEDLARQKGYGKIFAKISAPTWPVFQSADYVAEAIVPGFFNGRTDGYFISKYFSERRQKDHTLEKRLGIARPKKGNHAGSHRRGHWKTRHVVVCRASDAEQMSDIDHKVFRTYPYFFFCHSTIGANKGFTYRGKTAFPPSPGRNPRSLAPREKPHGRVAFFTRSVFFAK